MNQIRVDVLTDRRVIVAADRDHRPNAHHPEPSIHRDDDPFLEGHESETPAETLSLRKPGTLPDRKGWQIRVVPNRYPAVRSPDSFEHRTVEGPAVEGRTVTGHEVGPAVAVAEVGSEFFPTTPASGQHDVVIECPDHRTSLLDLSERETADVLTAWALRIGQLRQAGRHAAVAVFRNEGFSAGGSLSHCHSQIVATQDVMPCQQQRVDLANRYRHRTGREIVGDLLQAELMQSRRVVSVSPEFVWLCPFAPRTSWHLRAIPVDADRWCFDRLTSIQLQLLAGLLHRSLCSLTTILGPFSFNLTLVQAPFTASTAHRWMLDILPRRSRIAGWEILTDVDIVTVAPEVSAEQLRKLAADQSCTERNRASAPEREADRAPDQPLRWSCESHQ